MKLYINKTLSLLTVMAIVVFSCGENEEPVPFTEAENGISFPDYPTFSADFTTLDQVVLNVVVDGSATSLTVTGIDGGDYGSVAISGGTGTYTSSLAALGNPDEETLVFSDGATERQFDISIGNPASITSGNTDATVNVDSSYQIGFEAETVNGSITAWDLSTKVGVAGVYASVDTGAPAATSFADSTALNATGRSVGDTIFYRVVVSAGALSDTVMGSVIVVPVELEESGEFTLRTPDFDVDGAAGMLTDSLFNAFNFKTLDYVADSVWTVSADSADIQFSLNGTALELTTGAGSGTTFYPAPGFDITDANYEAVRDSVAASAGAVGLPLAVEGLDDDAKTFYVMIGNVGGSAPANDSKMYGVIKLGEITKDDDGVTSTITIEYVMPTQE